MKSKRLRLWLGAMGTLLLVPRALCVAASSSRLTDDDARVALEPLNRIHLGKSSGADLGPARCLARPYAWTADNAPANSLPDSHSRRGFVSDAAR